MTDVLFRLLWDCDGEAGVMESCYKLYTWINHTLLMLLLQIFWKISQISDFFKQKSVEENKSSMEFVFTPLTKESKLRRHIRSMSDVQNSTPYKIPFRSKKGSWTFGYDSDSRARRLMSLKHRYQESSDSSESFDAPKRRSIEYKIMKHSDSMRIL